ncbi:MAG: DUF4118 domain-containing protein [Acidobacteria bacterium]|nr:DUF4118 domain-containing protein [Acidobacteriota bacterium]
MNLRRPAELFENLALPHRLRPPQSYIVVLLLVALGTLVRWGMPTVLEATHFLAFYPVVVFAAILGGSGPGVLAIALSWVSVSFFFDYTPGTLSLGHPSELGRLLVFVVGGLGVAVVSEVQLRGRERQERQSQELMRLTQLTNLGPFIIRDRHDRITHWSDGCARMYGIDAKDAVGRVSHELLQTEFPEPPEQIYKTLRETGRWEGEVKHTKADGSVLTISSQWVLQNSVSDYAILEICSDVTAIKRTEESLRKVTRELRRSNQELENFAYIASHDLQEPLRGITGFLTLLQRRYAGRLDEKADEYIRYAVDGSVRMSQLINDLLTYSRVGRKELTARPTDMNHVVENALINLRTAVEESGARITCDELPTISGDQLQLTQLLQNLIGNAIKFRTPERTCLIHITAQKVDDHLWEFSVEDNGIGIEAEYYDRIFVIFRRLHSTKKYAGTGIGLALCKRIVERHGGRIWVESNPGEGSTFRFVLAS